MRLVSSFEKVVIWIDVFNGLSSGESRVLNWDYVFLACLRFQWFRSSMDAAFVCLFCLSGVSMISSFTSVSSYGSRSLFRRSSGVVNITHGMVVVSMEIFSLFTLLFKWFLYFMDAIICFVGWAVFKKVFMVSMISWFFSALSSFKKIFLLCMQHFFLCFKCAVIITHGMGVAFVEKYVFVCALLFQWFLHVMDAVISSFV